MKSLNALKTHIEKKLNTEFVVFPGPKNASNFYCPAPVSNPKSTRFWLVFKQGLDKDYCSFGDFANSKSQSVDIDFKSNSVNFSTGKPTKEEYEEAQNKFHRTAEETFSILHKGHNIYTESYKNLPASAYLLDDKSLAVPYRKNGKITAVLQISPRGNKRFWSGSEAAGSFHTIQPPRDTDSLVYIVEGLRTGYAVAMGCPKGSGVLSAGGFNNIESGIKVLKNNYKIVLCTERSNHDDYMKLKEKHQCFLVGSKYHEDYHHFYMDVGIEVLKNSLLKFKEKSFIPIGLERETNKVVCYIKNTRSIMKFNKSEAGLLYVDAHNCKNIPEKNIVDNFYLEVRMLCRFSGAVSNFQKIKEGIFPYKGRRYFYDTQNIYLIGKDKLSIIDPDNIVSDDCVLYKDKNHEVYNLLKLETFNEKEIAHLFSIFRLFGLSDINRKLLFAWIIQSSVCGALPYRTPVWLLAPSGTGKTQITNRVIRNFFVFYERKQGRQTTPKWIHREFNGKAIPLQRDEFDLSKRHSADAADEMECVRTTSTERWPERGISAGMDDATQTFCYCFSPLYSSIRRPPELTSADLARFVFVGMKRGFPKNYSRVIEKFEGFMDKKQASRFMKTCMFKIDDIIQRYKFLMSLEKYLSCGHERSSYFMLMSCFNSLTHPDMHIQLTDIEKFLKRDNETQLSRFLIPTLRLILKKSNYAIPENKTLFEKIDKGFEMKQGEGYPDDSGDESWAEHRGFYHYKNRLYMHLKRGPDFISQLYGDHNMPMIPENIVLELKEDGKLFLEEKMVGKLENQVLPRGKYLTFNYDEIRKFFLDANTTD